MSERKGFKQKPVPSPEGSRMSERKGFEQKPVPFPEKTKITEKGSPIWPEGMTMTEQTKKPEGPENTLHGRAVPNRKSTNILLCGVGGQGTVLASRLIAAAAMKKQIPVKTAETIGMSQRGGSVVSHIRLGKAYSPQIARGQADLIIGFEPAEALRMLPFLKEGGTVILSNRPVKPVSTNIGLSSYPEAEILTYLKAHTSHCFVVDPDKALQTLGNAKVLNMVLLGAAVRSHALPLTTAEIKDAITEKVPQKFQELNFAALEYQEDDYQGDDRHAN